MADAKKDKIPEIPEWPEETWLALAISAALILLILVVLGAIWMFQAFPDVEAMGARSRVLTPIGAAGLAVVTFCTVVWRGLVTTRQANEQIRTNNQKDEEILAKLLLDGTNCLHEEKEMRKLAGIAALSAVVKSPNERYAVPAMNILAQFIDADVNRTTSPEAWYAAIVGLNQGSEAGHRATKQIVLKAPDNAKTVEWPVINGANVQYYDGSIKGVNLVERFSNFIGVEFYGVRFVTCRLKRLPERLTLCEFVNCRFESFFEPVFSSFSVEGCDFSGATIDDRIRLNEERIQELKHSFFYEDNPPRSASDYDWSRVFRVCNSNQWPRPGTHLHALLYGSE